MKLGVSGVSVSDRKTMTNRAPHCPAMVPYCSPRRIARWPAMVPKVARTCWLTGKRSFSFLWTIPPNAEDLPIRLILRGNGVLIELLDGTIVVEDGLDSHRIASPRSVAVSQKECTITPALMPPEGVRALVHVVGTVPLRSMLKRHSHFSKSLEQSEVVSSGVYPLGHHHLTHVHQPLNVGRGGDTGERLVMHHLHHTNFIRFLASVPRALHKRESTRKKGGTSRNKPALKPGTIPRQ